MNVLSLFDGISCAMVALKRAGFNIESYHGSEVDKYAIQVSQKNFPEIKAIGNVKGLIVEDGWVFYNQDKEDLMNVGGSFKGNIDLLIGGSPCQDLSIAKNDRKGLDGERSGLFWEYVRILHEVKPKWFILENVASMPLAAKEKISETLGVQPIMIDASLVSAQSRKRLFWTNIPVEGLPENRGIILKDILQDGETDDLKSYCVTANYAKLTLQNYMKGQGQIVRVGQFGKGGQGDRIYSTEGKSVTLSANGGGRGAKTGLYKVGNINPSGRGMNGDVYSEEGKSPTLTTNKGEGRKILDGFVIRKLTPVECERLQGLPDGYTEGISNSQRYKCLGNAFNVDVITHILKHIPR